MSLHVDSSHALGSGFLVTTGRLTVDELCELADLLGVDHADLAGNDLHDRVRQRIVDELQKRKP